MVCGRIDGRPDARLMVFTEAARTAGIDIALSATIERERWQKFVFLVGLSGATATTRKALGPILADPDTRTFFHKLMSEVVTIGRAKGVSLPADIVEDRMKFAESSPPTFKASLLQQCRTRQSARTQLARREGGRVWPRIRRSHDCVRRPNCGTPVSRRATKAALWSGALMLVVAASAEWSAKFLS
jgi:hypothetical protein